MLTVTVAEAREIVAFLSDFSHLYNTACKDLFTTDTFQSFMQSCSYSGENVSWNDIRTYVLAQNLNNKSPPFSTAYKQFIDACEKYMHSVPVNTISGIQPMFQLPLKRVSEKKRKQLASFVPFLLDRCAKFGITRIVDIGCGTGTLLQTLQRFNFETVGIDCNRAFCEGAKKNTGNQSVILNFAITTESIPDILSIINDDDSRRTAVVSLHGCGDLQKAILHLFVQSNCHLLLTVGCCYHKRKICSTDSPNTSWTISKSINDLLRERQLTLDVPALRLGCDRGLHQLMTMQDDQLSSHLRAVYNRAVIQMVFGDKTGKRSMNRSLPSGESNQRLLIDAIMQQQNKLNDEVEHDEKQRQLTAAFNDTEQHLSVLKNYLISQAAIHEPLEVLLSLDSLIFLYEHGLSGELLRIFPDSASPRNICLVASRT